MAIYKLYYPTQRNTTVYTTGNNTHSNATEVELQPLCSVADPARVPGHGPWGLGPWVWGPGVWGPGVCAPPPGSWLTESEDDEEERGEALGNA